jgi:hypothetical protein
MTAMGVRFVQNAQCVGILVPVTQEELQLFDEREIGYERVLLNETTVNVTPVQFLKDKHYHGDDILFKNDKEEKEEEEIIDLKVNNIWMYVPEHPELPSFEYPIAQSYVDVIMRGCLSISEEFCKEFILNTRGWCPEELALNDDEYDFVTNSSCWVDDRHDPIYVRADRLFSNKRAKQLDYMLQSHKPDAFKRRTRFDGRRHLRNAKQ